MGCHIFDPVFGAIGLTAPVSVRSEGPPPNQWNWSLNGKVILHLRRDTHRTAAKTLPVTWYDGTSKPPAEVIALLEGDEFPGAGSIFIGTEGTMGLLPHFNLATLFPKAKFADFKLPHVKGLKHWEQFVVKPAGAMTRPPPTSPTPARSRKRFCWATSPRVSRKPRWNGTAAKMKFDLSEANQYVRREYRKGWEVKGL